MLTPFTHIVVRYRFTGHQDLGKNYGGIDSFFDAGFRAELTCLLGVNKDIDECPRPDVSEDI